MTSSKKTGSEPDTGYNHLPLKDRIAIVTGSSKGIGRGVAVSLAEAGAHIVVNGSRPSQELDEAAAEVEKRGRRVLMLPADVGDRPQIDEIIAKTIEHFGRVDILVNNAAIFKFTPFLELTDEDFLDVIRVNLVGPYYSSQAVAKHMIEKKIKGRIIMVGSVSAQIAQMEKVHYGAAKAGMEMMTKNMALELGPFGITVNCVVPGGPVISAQTEHILKLPDFEERIKRRIPVGRAGYPEDVGALVRFLASDEASFIHGAIMLVDGGMTLARE